MADAPYDVNFVFPVRELENDAILLTPFIPALHSQIFWESSKDYPEIWNHLFIGPYTEGESFITNFINPVVQPDPAWACFMILDKLSTPKSSKTSYRNYPCAGLISFIDASVQNKSTEIGWVIILPPFQRTHVTTNAAGLMLQYCFNPVKPLHKEEQPGLGLLRVFWQTSSRNTASVSAGKRLGFKYEALKRWSWIWPNNKLGNGIPVPPERGSGIGRDTVLLGLTYDDWINGEQERLRYLMDRRR